MPEKMAYIVKCGTRTEGVPIDVGKGLEEVIKTLMIVDSLVVDGDCRDPDTSLIAFLARLMDKRVYWTGKRPNGLLAELVTGRLK